MKGYKFSLEVFPLLNDDGEPIVDSKTGKVQNFQVRSSLFQIIQVPLKDPDGRSGPDFDEYCRTQDIRDALRASTTELILSKEQHEMLLQKFERAARQQPVIQESFYTLWQRVKGAKETELQEALEDGARGTDS